MKLSSTISGVASVAFELHELPHFPLLDRRPRRVNRQFQRATSEESSALTLPPHSLEHCY
jgi:hypothetical protein